MSPCRRIASLLALAVVPSSCKDAEPSEAPAPERSAAETPSVTAASDPAPEPPPPPPPPPPKIDLDGIEVVDLHVDTPWRVHFKGRDPALEEGHATPERVAEGRYAALVYPIYIPDYIHDDDPRISDADAIYETIDTLVGTHDSFHPAIGPGGERLEVPSEDVAIFVAVEGAGAFAEDITQIDRFIERGVRLVGPVHAHDNDLASSATGAEDSGLTELGKKFCDRVYENGALVDVSHMSDAAFADLVPIAKRHDAPVVATHSNARELASHPRNLTDEQLKIIADTGGVAGLNLHRRFVRGRDPRMKHVVAQVEHMVEVAGIDHVAIGTDFDGGNPAWSVRHAGHMPDLIDALKEAGLGEAELRKILGDNALRILYWGLEAGG